MDDYLNALHGRQVDARLRLLALVEAVLDEDEVAIAALSDDLESGLPAALGDQLHAVVLGAAWLLRDALAGHPDPRGWLSEQRRRALADRNPFA